MFSPFNYKEIDRLISQIAPEIEGMHVEKIFIPSRPLFSGGFIKSEWAIRLSSRQGEWDYVFSSRARKPYFAIYPKKILSPAKEGSRSGFDLSLNKELKGLKLERIRALPNERAVVLEFKNDNQTLALVQMMIPASPEALLLRGETLIATTKTGRDTSEKPFKLPDGTRAPPEMQIRTDMKHPDFSLYQYIEACLKEEAFFDRKARLEKEFLAQKKTIKENIRKNETSLKEAKNESPWKYYGDLLKGALSNPPPIRADKVRLAKDYEKDSIIEVPCDPKLDLKAQIEKFYTLSKRQSRRIQEAQNRITRLNESLKSIESIERLIQNLSPGDFNSLENAERSVGLSHEFKSHKEAQNSAGIGKLYFSADGLNIWAGRDREENLAVTFKIARGNDIWMHARGRTSAHVIIQLPPKKTASLETLLDAAHVLLHSSGGKDWGKTDIDYTFRKNVKKIKNSSEVTYTQNKTLSVTFDPKRMERLLMSANKTL